MLQIIVILVQLLALNQLPIMIPMTREICCHKIQEDLVLTLTNLAIQRKNDNLID